MNRRDAELLAAYEHGRTASVCAFKLVRLARTFHDAPATISEFVDAIMTGTPVYAIPADDKSLAVFSARRIVELATARRMTVAELLLRENVEDDLTRFRLTWRGR